MKALMPTLTANIPSATTSASPVALNKLHHVSLVVENLTESIEFYRDKLGLQQIDRPKFKFKGAWFRIPGGQFLHLVQKRTKQSKDGRGAYYRDNHFALRVNDIDKAVAYLRAKKLHPKIYKSLPSRFPQTYIRDPDGHVIEFNAAPEK
jgi:catechol 2,3-dioxygenase-like lactoylglutathione lyase family enzyme